MSGTTKASVGARELSRDAADLLAVPATDANRLGLPALIDSHLEPLLRLADQAQHPTVCTWHDDPDRCSCGLTALLEKWEPGR